ncbi:MAG: preprotein translocase subunit YajC [Rickettsiaceae bacterium]|nr:preprotein translocase subunit YajC [Rickettsiaceae bacterium]
MSDTNQITLAEQDHQTSSDVQSSVSTTFSSLTPILMIFVVFYFLVIRPQDKKKKEQESLVASVKRGEEVLTHSGIYGVVSKVTEGSDNIEITIAKDVNIKVLKSAIAEIISRKDVAANVHSPKNETTKKDKKATKKK